MHLRWLLGGVIFDLDSSEVVSSCSWRLGRLSLSFGDMTKQVADLLCQHFFLGEIRNLLRQSIFQWPSNVQHRFIVMVCPQFGSVILSNQVVDELIAAHQRGACLQLHRVFLLHWMLHTLVTKLALPQSPFGGHLPSLLGIAHTVPQFKAQLVWPCRRPLTERHLHERFFRQDRRVCTPTVLRLVCARLRRGDSYIIALSIGWHTDERYGRRGPRALVLRSWMLHLLARVVSLARLVAARADGAQR